LPIAPARGGRLDRRRCCDAVARHPAETTGGDEHHADAVIERELQRLGDSVLGGIAERMKTETLGIEGETGSPVGDGQAAITREGQVSRYGSRATTDAAHSPATPWWPVVLLAVLGVALGSLLVHDGVSPFGRERVRADAQVSLADQLHHNRRTGPP